VRKIDKFKGFIFAFIKHFDVERKCQLMPTESYTRDWLQREEWQDSSKRVEFQTYENSLSDCSQLSGSVPSLVAGVVAGCIAGFAAFTSNFYILTGLSNSSLKAFDN
jgi:hypothetical protein